MDGDFKMNIYGLRDKACGIMHVFIAANETAAKRAMSEAMLRNQGELIYRYAEDFDLYKICEIDTETGDMKNDKKEFVVNLKDLKKDEKNG